MKKKFSILLKKDGKYIHPDSIEYRNYFHSPITKIKKDMVEVITIYY